jgi:hypothetical protein
VRGFFKALALQRDDALVARRGRALVDGHGEMALAEQFAGRDLVERDRLDELGLVDMGDGAEIIGRVEIDDHHRDGAVALGLELEAALELERRAEQDGERAASPSTRETGSG